MEEEEENAESMQDRRKEYNAMRAAGVTDKDATEKVWPSTSAGILKHAKDRADAALKKEAAK